MGNKLSNYLPGILLFAIALVIGLAVYKDYGVSWDEGQQHTTGLMNFQYAFEGSKRLFLYADRFYGAGYELPLVMLEKALSLEDAADIIAMRHLCTHLLFLVAAFGMYVLVFLLFRNRWLACVAFLMLLMEPRLYAHSFFNSKDLPLLSMVIIMMLVSYLAFSRGRAGWYVLLGLVCGYAASIRIVAVIPAFIVFLFLSADTVIALVRKEGGLRRVVSFMVFICCFCVGICVAWPYLWPLPVNNLVESYQYMAGSRTSSGLVFFDGATVPVKEILPRYIATWFSITTPILWLMGGIAGVVLLIIAFCRKPLAYLSDINGRMMVLAIACFVFPVVAAIVAGADIYDDWRHLYFIYPGFVLMAAWLLHKAWHTRLRVAIQCAVALQIVFIGWFMVRSHPFQQVYFNELVSHKHGYLRRHYDMDYWGASFKQGLEYIGQTQPEGRIRVSSEIIRANAPLSLNMNLLPAEQRQRMEIVPARYANYFITNFRSHPEDYPYPVAYHISVCGDTILAVYKVPADELHTY